jgi:hypothetical protein
VNFFGHAVIAHEHRRVAAFALGAMLPDFASMCQGRLAGATDDEVAAGIDFHHRIDAAFHRLPGFAALCRDAEARLRRAGAARGPARGAAHAGTELLLDGAWLDDPGAVTYIEALDAARPDQLGERLSWANADGAERFEALRARLAARGLPSGYLVLRAELPAIQAIVFERAAAIRGELRGPER